MWVVFKPSAERLVRDARGGRKRLFGVGGHFGFRSLGVYSFTRCLYWVYTLRGLYVYGFIRLRVVYIVEGLRCLGEGSLPLSPP